MTLAGTDDDVRPALQEMLRAGELPMAPLTAIELRLRSKRSLSSRFDAKLLAMAGAVVVLVVLAFTAGPLRTDHHRAASPSPATGVPHGWATYSAYGLQISVPKSWSVQYFGECPDGQTPGTLFIGAPQSEAFCPEYGSSTAVVSLSDEGEHSTPSEPEFRTVHVHGLSVEESGTSAQKSWVVPTHAATVNASGRRAFPVLQTLAPATSPATPADGIASGTAQLLGIPGGTPITGKVEATETQAGRKRTVLVIDGQFWIEGAPGPYRLSVTSEKVPCNTVTVRVLAGQRVTAAPIVCQGE